MLLLDQYNYRFWPQYIHTLWYQWPLSAGNTVCANCRTISWPTQTFLVCLAGIATYKCLTHQPILDFSAFVSNIEYHCLLLKSLFPCRQQRSALMWVDWLPLNVGSVLRSFIWCCYVVAKSTVLNKHATPSWHSLVPSPTPSFVPGPPCFTVLQAMKRWAMVWERG